MPQSAISTANFALPALFAPDRKTAKRTLEFFTAQIRNTNTRRAYARAVADFGHWCANNDLHNLADIEPVHVAAYVEDLQKHLKAPSVKIHLAGLRMLFDWLVLGQIIATNPAAFVRGPKHSAKKGKTKILSAGETRTLLDSIDTGTLIGLRDRALIALMVYTFARVGAAAEKMRVEDVFIQNKRLKICLHEKGGKRHEMPCHHNLEAYLQEYMDEAGFDDDPKSWLFPTMPGHGENVSDRPMSQSAVFQMIRRRAAAAGIKTNIGCHSFRATGITEYLRNGGLLEKAQAMANHESARTTGLYDRRDDDVTLDEVERILI